jgi:hypothetical protein
MLAIEKPWHQYCFNYLHILRQDCGTKAFPDFLNYLCSAKLYIIHGTSKDKGVALFSMVDPHFLLLRTVPHLLDAVSLVKSAMLPFLLM